MNFDPVNNPKHYHDASITIQPIEVLRFLPFNLGNALKYILRAPYKGKYIEDLKKADYYLEDFLSYSDYPKFSENAWWKIQFFCGKSNNGILVSCILSAENATEFAEELQKHIQEIINREEFENLKQQLQGVKVTIDDSD